MKVTLPFFTLLLLISFASVNAVLFTPALPNIAQFFNISEDVAQQTVTWFLIGYALGQLMYGPIANRLGRKPALYIGIFIQIISSLGCVLAGLVHFYWLLVAARFMMALGAGVGLKMTFTLVNECYMPEVAAQKISYLMLAFAITPGLGVALGGFLTAHFGWMSCFYASAVYGVILLLLVIKLPETQKIRDVYALKLHHLVDGYKMQFKNLRLVAGGLLMGASTSFIYIFAALAPFIAIDLFKISSDLYGIYNCIPPIGLLLGSLLSAKFSKNYSFSSNLGMGIGLATLACIGMLVSVFMNINVLFSLFFPMVVIYFGLCFIMANASVMAMNGIKDKAHGAAVMSFINMGLATFAVFSLSYFPIKTAILPISYLSLCALMTVLWRILKLQP